MNYSRAMMLIYFLYILGFVAAGGLIWVLVQVFIRTMASIFAW